MDKTPSGNQKLSLRNSRVSFRCSEDEKVAFAKLAKKENSTVSKYYRDKLRQMIDGCIQLDKADLQFLNADIYERKKLGNNLNQIAHHLNSGVLKVDNELIIELRKSQQLKSRAIEKLVALKNDSLNKVIEYRKNLRD